MIGIFAVDLFVTASDEFKPKKKYGNEIFGQEHRQTATIHGFYFTKFKASEYNQKMIKLQITLDTEQLRERERGGYIVIFIGWGRATDRKCFMFLEC